MLLPAGGCSILPGFVLAIHSKKHWFSLHIPLVLAGISMFWCFIFPSTVVGYYIRVICTYIALINSPIYPICPHLLLLVTSPHRCWVPPPIIPHLFVPKLPYAASLQYQRINDSMALASMTASGKSPAMETGSQSHP